MQFSVKGEDDFMFVTTDLTCEDFLVGQFIATFPAGWSPQMVVIVRESRQNPLNSGLGIIVICLEM